MKHGGNQGGRPKGSKGQKTLDKEAARDLLREMVKAKLGPLTEAQISNAMGIKYLMAREKKGGKWVRLTADMAKAIQDGSDLEHETIEVYEKDPSVHAFQDLLDRTLDKAAQPKLETSFEGNITLKWQG